MSARTVLITGARRGVGRAAADRFRRAGWRVVAGVRDPAAADLRAGDDLSVVRMDMSHPGQVRAAVAAAEHVAGGALDCLVNNAAYGLLGAVEDVDLDASRAMFETNVFGVMAAIQAALPAMRAAGAGAVVNVNSIGGRVTNPLVGVYHASKYALTALSEALAMEVGRFGVRVVTVEPGMIATGFSASVTRSGSLARGEGPYAELLAGLSAGFRDWRARYEVPPEEVAEAIFGAATDSATPFRVLVGRDAELIARERAALDDADFQRFMAEFLGLG